MNKQISSVWFSIVGGSVQTSSNIFELILLINEKFPSCRGAIITWNIRDSWYNISNFLLLSSVRGSNNTPVSFWKKDRCFDKKKWSFSELHSRRPLFPLIFSPVWVGYSSRKSNAWRACSEFGTIGKEGNLKKSVTYWSSLVVKSTRCVSINISIFVQDSFPEWEINSVTLSCSNTRVHPVQKHGNVIVLLYTIDFLEILIRDDIGQHNPTMCYNESPNCYDRYWGQKLNVF